VSSGTRPWGQPSDPVVCQVCFIKNNKANYTQAKIKTRTELIKMLMLFLFVRGTRRPEYNRTSVDNANCAALFKKGIIRLKKKDTSTEHFCKLIVPCLNIEE
jgi:hypothetical protein